MSASNAIDMHRLADCFLAIAGRVHAYRIANGGRLSKIEDKALKDFHKKLVSQVQQLTTLSATVEISEIAGALQELQSVTEKINADFLKLKQVQQAIDIAAACVAMVSAICGKNVSQIRENAVQLAKMIKPSGRSLPLRKRK